MSDIKAQLQREIEQAFGDEVFPGWDSIVDTGMSDDELDYLRDTGLPLRITIGKTIRVPVSWKDIQPEAFGGHLLLPSPGYRFFVAAFLWLIVTEPDGLDGLSGLTVVRRYVRRDMLELYDSCLTPQQEKVFDAVEKYACEYLGYRHPEVRPD